MALNFFPKLIYDQLFVKPEYPTKPLPDQTIIVTGANSGLGYEAVKHFVRLGAKKVILTSRSTEAGEKCKSEIEKEKTTNTEIEVWPLDLCSYASVKAFAARANALDRLDVLLENAGVSGIEFKMAEEDESTITTNVVSTFLLGLMILPKLKESAIKFNVRPHWTVVTSEMHFLANMAAERKAENLFEGMSDKSKAKMFQRYSVSKLMEVLLVHHLVQNYAKTDYPVIINCLNPGLCHSRLIREDMLAVKIISSVMKFFLARTTEMGARTLVAGATAGEESHGTYMSNGVVEPPSAFASSEEGRKLGERIWKELSVKLERIDPGVTGNL
ncbi:short-chain dehydrogenase/reductase [Aulographum hederae CBS 113979]|uniref:Short-chain dehydrogenase/reductase n=1 Tax=Aulographum hederae CBS 113979 TaxID=1176131 RepID=A0A6G1GWP5_9PEZI|nr:short-chain dehydrogenase/reductase [Aulographum hederae CBS 113979]